MDGNKQYYRTITKQYKATQTKTVKDRNKNQTTNKQTKIDREAKARTKNG